MFVSTRLGFVRTAIKGRIDATPIISSKAIIKIITTNRPAFLRSFGVSKNNNYCKPVINTKAKKAFIEAKDIRHPIIEKIQTNELYVPNDISIGKKKDGMLIFGTNGVGKSSIK